MDVTADDLTKPLGLDRHPDRLRSWRVPVAPILCGLLALLVGGIATYAVLVDDPLAGEPHAIVPIEIAAAPAPALPSPAPRPDSGAEPPSRTASEVEDASGVSIMRPNGTAAPGAVIIRVPEPAGTKLLPAPDPRLVERSRHGLLPKIGPDGAKPWQVYARPAAPAGARPPARIALVVTGLGISQSATAGALAKLPPPVTLAFAPYGADLEKTAAAARAEGHEVMLQVPMEPFDYPDSDPGPHTLTARAKPQENLEKLHWAMGRFTGYIGLVNFMGAKLTADEAALAPILKEVGGRGLVFLDDGSSSRSLAGAVASSVRAPGARADAVLDGSPQAEAIDRELARLEELAKKRGLAIATASALPVTVERIQRWSRSLEARNIQLVPVSSAYLSEGR
ncbi:MAG TPA: divergent polysaccharide deacetylase family protein [Beijerinckiaceae bacterium]